MPGETVTVYFWASRLFHRAKSLTGHVALKGSGIYASWAPDASEGVRSLFGGVGPSPRASYERDVGLAGGVHAKPVHIRGLDVAAMRATWVGMATHMADPSVHGPPIAYELAPSVTKGASASCATVVVKLLKAGGSDARLAWPSSVVVTPRAVYEYALALAAR